MLQRNNGKAVATQTDEELMGLIEKELAALSDSERAFALRVLADKMPGLVGAVVDADTSGAPLDPATADLLRRAAVIAQSDQQLDDIMLGGVGPYESPDILRADAPPTPSGVDLYEALGTAHFKHQPVDMETFVLDPYFLGNTCDVIFPKLLRDLDEVFRGDYNEVIFTGALGTGKTFASSIGICRGLYELSCMRDPQKSFKLSADTQIVFAGFSVREELAKEVVLKNVVGKIAASPYFMDKFKPRITQKNIRFPGNIIAVARATTDTGVLGMAVYMALMDETDFMPTKRSRRGAAGPQDSGIVSMAKAIYDGTRRRMAGRFGRFGKMFLPCSKTTTESFLQTRVQAAERDPRIFVRDYAVWEVKAGVEKYSETKFWVLCGNEVVNSRIIATKEEKEHLERTLPERTTLVEVPDDYRDVFEADLEGSIRDMAGVATVAICPFFQQRNRIHDSVVPERTHPFSVEVLDPSVGGEFKFDEMVQEYEVMDPYNGRYKVRKPIRNPHAPRFIHIDAAWKQCAAGFVVLHEAGSVEVMRGNGYIERAPLVEVDFMLQIVPPTGGEIEIGMFRRLVYDLADMGYPIQRVTLDQAQSVDTLQILARAGYETAKVSSDWAAYQALKNTIYENRLRFYQYNPMLRELRSVEADWEKRKIIKPLEYEGKPGSKDMTDALAGALKSLLDSPRHESLPPLKGYSRIHGNMGVGMETDEESYAAMQYEWDAGTDTALPQGRSPVAAARELSGMDTRDSAARGAARYGVAPSHATPAFMRPIDPMRQILSAHNNATSLFAPVTSPTGEGGRPRGRDVPHSPLGGRANVVHGTADLMFLPLILGAGDDTDGSDRR